MIYFFIVFLFASSFIILLLSDSIFQIANIHFYLYIGLFILDFLKTRSISLYQVWIVGFIYIILSEILLYDLSVTDLDFIATRFLLTANNLVLIGYLLHSILKPLKENRLIKIIHYQSYASKVVKNKRLKVGFLFIIVFLIIYIYYFLPGALQSMSYGRNVSIGVDDTSITLAPFLSSIGLVLPAIIAYYVKVILQKRIFVSLILVSPIFIILFLNGTRFPLLFSLTGYLTLIGFLKLYNLKFKQIINLGVIVLLFVSATSIMNGFRVGGFTPDTLNKISHNNQEEIAFSKKVASKMSPEGVYNMTKLNIDYFKKNPHTIGLSTGFLLYFWVPRAIWPEKPTMLGYWLVRKYQGGFGVGHSASFGFAGELFADFGYLSLFFIFLFGILLWKLEKIRYQVLEGTFSFKMVIVSMFLPYVFFIVRSPITSTITFIGIYIQYLLFKKILIIK